MKEFAIELFKRSLTVAGKAIKTLTADESSPNAPSQAEINVAALAVVGMVVLGVTLGIVAYKAVSQRAVPA